MRLHHAAVLSLLIAPALMVVDRAVVVTAQGISARTKTASPSRT
jgi:hypothetical protein